MHTLAAVGQLSFVRDSPIGGLEISCVNEVLEATIGGDIVFQLVQAVDTGKQFVYVVNTCTIGYCQADPPSRELQSSKLMVGWLHSSVFIFAP